MKHTNILDVLVVYSADIATNPLDTLSNSTMPFAPETGRSHYNQAYAYFLESCQKMNLKAALSTSASIVGAGTCQGFWTYQKNGWQKTKNLCKANHIFDKFSPINTRVKKRRQLLFSQNTVRPFNKQSVSELFTDKFETYLQLTKYSIPTVKIESSEPTHIADALTELDHLINQGDSKDFESGLILKDRFGAGGNDIFLINSSDANNQISQIVAKHPQLSFVLQPMVKFETGFTYQGTTAATDIRLIYQNGQIIQSYIRMAKEGDFRCNEHQGGKLLYVDISAIPSKVIETSKQIAQKIGTRNSLYALDFIVSNHGNVYLLEGNSSPGIDWNLKLEENEKKSKQLITSVVKEFAHRITNSSHPTIAFN